MNNRKPGILALIIILIAFVLLQQTECRYRYRTEPMPDEG